MSTERSRTIEVSIANAASLSPEVDLGAGVRLVGIYVGTALEATSVLLGFEAALVAGGTFVPVWGSGGSARYTEVLDGADPLYIALDPVVFKGLRFIKFETLTTLSASDAQTGVDPFTLVVVPDDERHPKRQ